MYEKGLTLWSILFFYYDVAPLGLLRCRPSGACTPSGADCTPSEADCTPSEADCTPSEAEVSRMSTMLEIQGGVS